MDSTKLFTQTHPVKLFFTASIPGAVSMLASSLYQTLDGVFVGQFIGPTAFAAINLAMPFVIINFSLADLLSLLPSVWGRRKRNGLTTFSPVPAFSFC